MDFVRLGISWLWFWSQSRNSKASLPKEDSCWGQASFERWSCFSGALYWCNMEKPTRIQLLWGKNDLWLVVIGNFPSQSLPLGSLQDLHINTVYQKNVKLLWLSPRKTIVNRLRLIPSCQRPHQHKDTRFRHDLVVLCLQAGGKKPRPSEKRAHMQTWLHLGNDEFGEHSGPTSSDRVQSPPLLKQWKAFSVGKPSMPVNMRIHLSS